MSYLLSHWRENGAKLRAQISALTASLSTATSLPKSVPALESTIVHLVSNVPLRCSYWQHDRTSFSANAVNLYTRRTGRQIGIWRKRSRRLESMVRFLATCLAAWHSSPVTFDRKIVVWRKLRCGWTGQMASHSTWIRG